MKVWLMHPDRDFDLGADLPGNVDDLTQDLALPTIVRAAAREDEFVSDVFARALLGGAPDADSVAHRQQVLADCRERPELIRELYALSTEAVAAEKRVLRPWSHDEPSAITRSSVELLELLAGHLRRLRTIADEHASEFDSPGWRRFYTEIAAELDDDYLARMDAELKDLHFPFGELISARLGSGNRGIHYVARRTSTPGLLGRLGMRRAGYGFTIPDRDEAGFQSLRELENRGLSVISGALEQAVTHVRSFFAALRTELAFFVGSLNLWDALDQIAAPLTAPALAPAATPVFRASGLYDVALALTIKRCPVTNDVSAIDRPLVMITGANQGGKSTLLRAIGQAQLMISAGLPVAGLQMRANLCHGVFTHFQREEDASMQSGKLDEELARMSAIADRISPGGLLLCNESFASTNEREGSEIARQIIRAMLDSGVKVVFVTHQYDLADGLWKAAADRTLFLRAERSDSGGRTYRLIEGRPLPTSYGADSFASVFGRTLVAAPEDDEPDDG